MGVVILIGDVREKLRELPAESVDCVVTSPPYWGLRDYGVDGQIGLERTLGEHLDVMVEVFDLVRRVMKPSATLWLNYGDCYAAKPNGRSAADTKAAGNDDRTFRDKPIDTTGPVYGAKSGQPFSAANGTNRRGGGDASAGAIFEPNYQKGRGVHDDGTISATTGRGVQRVEGNGRITAGAVLKPKDLCMIPNRLAIALQEAGWWVRSEIIWGKPNAMPDSSGTQRPSTAHEKIFLLAKSIDGPVWRARDTGELSFAPDLSEHCALLTDPNRKGPRWLHIGNYYDANSVRQGDWGGADKVKMPDGWDTGPGGHGSHHRQGREKGKTRAVDSRSDKQRGHSRRHAGFNDRWDQMERSEQTANGRLLRNYEPAPPNVWEMAISPFAEAHFATFPPELAERCIRAGCPEGGVVLDPFGGAGTTGLVADRLQRSAILIELNPEYAEMARKRIDSDAGRMFTQPTQAVASASTIDMFGERDA